MSFWRAQTNHPDRLSAVRARSGESAGTSARRPGALGRLRGIIRMPFGRVRATLRNHLRTMRARSGNSAGSFADRSDALMRLGRIIRRRSDTHWRLCKIISMPFGQRSGDSVASFRCHAGTLGRFCGAIGKRSGTRGRLGGISRMSLAPLGRQCSIIRMRLGRAGARVIRTPFSPCTLYRRQFASATYSSWSTGALAKPNLPKMRTRFLSVPHWVDA